MKIQYTVLIGALILTVMTFAPIESRGQADPAWLINWNEAQKTRPLTMSSSARIAAEGEPGIPLIINGRVFAPDGTPVSGIVVHAYHRDRDGFEFGPEDSSLRTWRLQGWAKTGDKGRFEFKTIRPAPDHLGREGAHIHFTLESVEYGRQWAPTVFLSDDPQVTADQRRRSKEAGEFAWVREVQIIDGIQHIKVRFQLKEKADF